MSLFKSSNSKLQVAVIESIWELQTLPTSLHSGFNATIAFTLSFAELDTASVGFTSLAHPVSKIVKINRIVKCFITTNPHFVCILTASILHCQAWSSIVRILGGLKHLFRYYNVYTPERCLTAQTNRHGSSGTNGLWLLFLTERFLDNKDIRKLLLAHITVSIS